MIPFANEVPWLVPGSLIALVVSLLAARPVGRWLGVSAVVAGVMILNLGVFLAATLTPQAFGFPVEVAVARTCDMSRIGLASPADWFNPPDTAGNIIALIPLGFAIALIPSSRRKAAVLIGAVALPFVIESIQLIASPLGRGCQSSDVIDNLTGLFLGLAAGAVAAWVVGRLAAARSGS